jgi:hypothetical protein
LILAVVDALVLVEACGGAAEEGAGDEERAEEEPVATGIRRAKKTAHCRRCSAFER